MTIRGGVGCYESYNNDSEWQEVVVNAVIERLNRPVVQIDEPVEHAELVIGIANRLN
jgi:hypothetical protein